MPRYSGPGFADFVGEHTEHARHYGKVLEEFIEMLAMSFLLVGFLAHLMRRYPAISIGAGPRR